MVILKSTQERDEHRCKNKIIKKRVELRAQGTSGSPFSVSSASPFLYDK